ncbi:MAG: TRAP transporter substrate-binding protein DctP [Rhodospirillales bacterium]|nr:TRAP transporter substrate-binding protein DctP [Rhodospirillales bacterium]
MKIESILRKSAYVVVGATIVLSAQALITEAYAETKTLTANYFSTRKSPIWTGLMKPWIDEVEKASNGTLKIFVPTASLAPAPRQWDIVAKGSADIAVTPNTFKRNILHLTPIAELPFVIFGSQASTVAVTRTHHKHFAKAKEYDSNGMHLLMPYALAGHVLHSLKGPLTSISSFKGMKMQGDPGRPKFTLDALGATAVVAPGIKIFEMMSKGIVDGAMYPNATTFVFRAGRYVKHVTEVPGKLGNISWSFIMNKKVYDGLSGEHRRIIDAASAEKMAFRYGGQQDKQEAFARQDHMKGGTKYHTASPELVAEMQKRLAFITDEWVERANKRGVDGAAALKYFKEQAKAVAKM